MVTSSLPAAVKVLITESWFVMNPFVWYIAEYKLLTFESITMELVKLHKQQRDLQGGEGDVYNPLSH